MAVLYTTQLNELDELGINAKGTLRNPGDHKGGMSKTLIIGLGGMGLRTLRNLKKELLVKFSTINGNGLRFLSIDTDKIDCQYVIDEGVLNEEDVLNIDFRLAQIFNHDEDEIPAAIRAIIPNHYKAIFFDRSVCASRLIGRIALMETNVFNTICERLKSAIIALGDLNGKILDVHVVAGIGGGTGGGFVIDIPYLVRRITNELGVPENRLRLCGHIYLPDVYRHLGYYDIAKANGYAALKEIDYYMNIEAIGEEFEALYPDGKYTSRKNIFDRCELIDGKSIAPIVIENSFENAISVCVSGLINSCVETKLCSWGIGYPIPPLTLQNYSVPDVFSNANYNYVPWMNAGLFSVLTNPDNRFPAYANYSYDIVGSASVKIPRKEIYEELVGEISKRAEVIYISNTCDLKQSDIDEFEKGLINPYEIIGRQRAKLSEKMDEYLNSPELSWNRHNFRDPGRRESLQYMISNLIGDFYNDKEFFERVLEDAKNKAEAIFKDSKKGPYYLSLLLESRVDNGGLSGYYQRLETTNLVVDEIQRKAHHTVISTGTRLDELENTMERVLRFNHNLPIYKETLKQFYEAMFTEQFCEYLKINFYFYINKKCGFVYELKRMLDECFVAKAEIIKKINSVAIKNLEVAKESLNSESNAPLSIFNIDYPVLDRLKEVLRNTVGNYINSIDDTAVERYAEELASEIIRNRDTRVSEREAISDWADTFREFISGCDLLYPVLNRTISDYLDEAYRGATSDVKNRVVKVLIDVTKSRSAPLCKVRELNRFDLYNLTPLCYSYLTLPLDVVNNPDWGPRFAELFGTGSMENEIYVSPNDAICCNTGIVRMPIWIYEGLAEYEKAYERFGYLELHINENTDTKPALRDYPALMIPSQWWRAKSGDIEYVNECEQIFFEELRAKFNYAKEHHIIEKDGNGIYAIRTIANKPVLNNDEPTEQLLKFRAEYISNPKNRDDIGDINIKDNLFNALLSSDSFGKESSEPIKSIGGVRADTDENAVILLRKQMKLYQTLVDEIEAFKRLFLRPLSIMPNLFLMKRDTRDFTAYMLHGFIYNGGGAWFYDVGDDRYPIVLKIKIPANLKEYAEIDVVDKLFALEDFVNTHRTAINNVMDEYVNNMTKGVKNGPELLEKMIERAKALKTRCEAVIEELRIIYKEKGSFTPDEELRKQFYGCVLDHISFYLGSFGITL